VTELSPDTQAALLESNETGILSFYKHLAELPGPIIPLHALTPGAIAAGFHYNPGWLLAERSLSTNIAAAGGNAALMAKI
ncbi:MAG: hypothetical protein KGJ73_12420, partial [Rhodospirillales bacterium]|nr:hypothetical protein [Rhodospirillales bacterium]